ncbi:uncharacterized protein si:ch1073-291c23.2 isoform X2 [Pimephales promelas]|uniref:uncharacterized protein si:ch1073-291c23.2 isoform X2 n=1 Tax=Pimephales promelas TaxID=90988 RepID=UPI0019559E23|nr:uncharacterized protein si:ch1073-291c23.2 isoform X2 [Pimephales promelas]
MVEGPATTGASEPISVVTGGSKPVHRFLKGQPMCIGTVLVMMAVCMIMFGFAMDVQSDAMTSADMYTPFWLAILFFICGVLYILCEHNPSKKIITASLALSIISTLGVFFGCVGFVRAIVGIHDTFWSHFAENQTVEERQHMEQHYAVVVMRNLPSAE